jgi:ferredoxin-thioredoxin reductase catalytic subunit
MEVKTIDNKDLVQEIRQKIKDNDGYCPCRLEKTKDTKCMCKDFIENAKPGEECHCGLYIKVKE